MVTVFINNILRDITHVLAPSRRFWGIVLFKGDNQKLLILTPVAMVTKVANFNTKLAIARLT